MKNIILCADDYGQNPAISQAIIELIENKRLSATSCMINSPYWPQQAKKLYPFKGQVDLGLHINLTTGPALSKQFIEYYGDDLFPLNSLIIKSHLGFLNKMIIKAEIEAQLNSYIDVMQQTPDFIDGHQHIHQFPMIRDIIIEIYEQRLRNKGSYIRCVVPMKKCKRSLKSLIIQLTGANELKRRLVSLNIPHNSSFAGIYDFADAADYPRKFPLFLDELADNGLIMCHPGHGLDTDFDPIYSARQYEFQYFSSENFLRDCDLQKVRIGRFT